MRARVPGSSSRHFGVRVGLLLPPLRLAALQLGLRLRDVGPELGLLLGEPLLELGAGHLALLELVEPDLVVGHDAGLALLKRRLAVVELPDPLVDGGLQLADARLAALGPLLLRIGGRLVAGEIGLALGELPLALLEPDVPLVEVAALVGLPFGVADRGLQPVELGLARGQLELALVELLLALSGLVNEPSFVGELVLKLLGVVAETLLPEQELGLALADPLVPGGDPRGLLLQVGLA